MKTKAFGVLAATILALSMTASCIKDDRSDCFLSVRFRYAYNVKEADAFPAEVREIELYIFDAEGKFVERFQDRSSGFSEDYRMRIPSLEAGSYTFVALGRNRPVDDFSKEFEFSGVDSDGAGLSDLLMHLNNKGGVCDREIAALYDGTCEVSLKDGAQQVTVEMKKLTNKFRIIIMPYDGVGLSAEEFDISIESNATRMDYKGDPYEDYSLKYLPYMQETLYSIAGLDGGEVSGAVVADLNTSRLMYTYKPTLVIRRIGDGGEVLRVNLSWILSLQGIAEHRSEWSNQEYLDRQDYYSLTFFLDGGLFMKSRIIINGWILSLSDVTLG